jgi:hypothetical protein
LNRTRWGGDQEFPERCGPARPACSP